MSLAIVAPSLEDSGEPNFFSSNTWRARGPKVTFTVLARASIPRNMSWRAVSPKWSCLAAIVSSLSIGVFQARIRGINASPVMLAAGRVNAQRSRMRDALLP